MAEDGGGTGGIQSPPDERDVIVGELPAALTGPAAALPSFRLGNRPPVVDQGWTPQCVAYSSGVEQNWQDRVEHGRFFDFDEGRFFDQIGGTPAGAYMRAALDRRLDFGMPEQDATPSPARHQIRSYALVTKSVQAIKDAIVATGGVLVVGPWYPNWTERHGSLQVLPRPSGGGTGHAWWAIGWDEYGCLGQQSWGPLWGDGGLFRMPWTYVVNYMWEVWATLDEVTTQAVVKARIPTVGVTIYDRQVLDGASLERHRWAQTRQVGIRRLRDGEIVATPFNKAFPFGGFELGTNHGIEPRPAQWAKVRINGYWRAVPRPQVRLT